MGKVFDPYHRWLGIRPEDRPLSHYRLLGLVASEDDQDVIQDAADSRMAHVRTYQTGPHAADSQRILNELAAAQLCLMDPVRKAAYDATLPADKPPAAPAPAPAPVAAEIPAAATAQRLPPARRTVAPPENTDGEPRPEWHLPAAIGGGVFCIVMVVVIAAFVTTRPENAPKQTASATDGLPRPPQGAITPVTPVEPRPLVPRPKKDTAPPTFSTRKPPPPGPVPPPPFLGGLLAPAGKPFHLRKADIVFEGRHSNTITEYALGPRGALLTATTTEGLVTWDVGTGRYLRTGSKFRGPAAGSSPDGRRLAISDYSKLSLWDFETGTLEREMRLPFKDGAVQVRHVGFSPDATLAAVACGRKEVVLVDFATGNARAMPPLSDHCSRAVLSLDARQFFAVTGERIERFSLPDCEPLAPIEAKVHRGCFTPIDGKRAVAISAADRRLMSFWDLVDGTMIEEVTLPAEIGYMCVTPDRRGVVLKGDDRVLYVWHFGAKREVARIYDSGAYYLVVTPDGYVVAGNTSLSAWRLPDSVWDRPEGSQWVSVDKKPLVDEPAGEIPPLPFAGGLRQPAGAEPVTLGETPKIGFESKHKASITALALGPPGQIFSATSTGETCLWDVGTGKNLPFTLAGSLLAGTPDGGILAIGSATGIKVWDAIGQNVLCEIRTGDPPRDLTISADGALVAGTFTARPHLRVWESATGGERFTVAAKDWPTSVHFTLDSRQLFVGFSRKFERYRAAKGELLATVETTDAHQLTPIDVRRAAAMSSSGERRSIAIWDIPAGKVLTRIDHPADVRRFSLTSDRRGLVTYAEDSMLRVWDLESGCEVARLKTSLHTKPFVTPDGYVLSGNFYLGAWKLADSVWDRPAGSEWVVPKKR